MKDLFKVGRVWDRIVNSFVDKRKVLSVVGTNGWLTVFDPILTLKDMVGHPSGMWGPREDAAIQTGDRVEGSGLPWAICCVKFCTNVSAMSTEVEE